MKGIVIRNTHMKYESSIFNGLKVMDKVKVFVHAANADADADIDTGADISSPDIRPGSLKIPSKDMFLNTMNDIYTVHNTRFVRRQ